MQFTANEKVLNVISASSSVSGYAGVPTVSGTIDTSGWDYLTVFASIYSSNNTPSGGTIKLQNSDTNGSFADVTGSTITLGASANGVARINVDLRAGGGYKRWFNVVVTPSGAATNLFNVDVKGILGRPQAGGAGFSSLSANEGATIALIEI